MFALSHKLFLLFKPCEGLRPIGGKFLVIPMQLFACLNLVAARLWNAYPRLMNGCGYFAQEVAWVVMLPQIFLE